MPSRFAAAAVLWAISATIAQPCLAEEDFFQKGLRLSREHRFEEALGAFSKAIEARPDDADAYNYRGAVQYYRKEYGAAIEDYTRAIELRPLSAGFYNNRGSAWLQNKELDRALLDFHSALEIEPQLAAAHKNRGVVFYLREDYEEAIRSFTRALEIQPDTAAFHNNRGSAWYRKGNPLKALQDYTRAAELRPGIAEAYKNRGLVWFRMGLPERAIKDFGKALQADPSSAGVYISRGRALVQRGSYNEALNDYIEALRLDPDSADHCRELAWMLSVCPDEKYRNGPRALELALKAVSIREEVDTLDTLAAAWAGLGEFNQAVQVQERVVSLARASRSDELQNCVRRLESYRERQPWRSIPRRENARPFPAEGMIAVPKAHIRSGTSKKHAIIADLRRGEKVLLLGREGEWHLLEMGNGRLGWGHESVLSTIPVSTEGPVPAPKVLSAATLVVAVDSGRVREQASSDARIIGGLKRGDRVPVIRTAGDWHQITLPNGKPGWANRFLFNPH